MNQAKYDKTDPFSIFNYSKLLLNHCLRDFAPDAEERIGKGGLGQLVEELYFEYKVNSDSEPDFAEAGLELKCTPLKLSKDQELLIKERLVCGMINYCEEYQKPFEESHFYQKCLLMLILFYMHKAGTSRLDLQFLFALLWKLPEKDLVIIRNDYKVIIDKINAGQAHLLSEGDTMYLGACRKGQKGDSLERQPKSDIRAPRRAWSLKPSYMRTLLDYVQKSNCNATSNLDLPQMWLEQTVTLKQLKKTTFDDILLKRFKPFMGKTSKQIFKKLDMLETRAKSRFAMAANAIAGEKQFSNINLSEEFQKAGLIMKTIRVEQNGRIRECMSFENIDYQEIYECDEWTDSRLYEIFSNRFLFVTFKATGKKIRVPAQSLCKAKSRLYDLVDEYALDKVFFWTMPQEDLEIAKAYWEDIRKQVLADNIKDGAFWGMAKHNNFHVRPKGRKDEDKAISPVTGEKNAEKLCYWFNNDYVKKIIEAQ